MVFTFSLSDVIAVIALIISSVTAWVTLFHRGTIKMTQPAVIFWTGQTSAK